MVWMGCVSERTKMLSFRPRGPVGNSLYQAQAVAEWCVPISCWRNIALPIFKPLVLSFTAFNPPKPVTLIVRRTEDILSLAAVWFFCFTYQWEQDWFCHQGLWCFELQGVDRGGLAWLTLSCSFVYFNSYSQECAELTALPLKVSQKLLRARNGTLSVTFLCLLLRLKKKRKSSLFAFRNLPFLSLRSNIQSEMPLFSAGNAGSYNWGFWLMWSTVQTR